MFPHNVYDAGAPRSSGYTQYSRPPSPSVLRDDPHRTGRAGAAGMGGADARSPVQKSPLLLPPDPGRRALRRPPKHAVLAAAVCSLL
jgi:hypothetical protein